MDTLTQLDVDVYQNAEQKREDVLWKYKYFVLVLREQQRHVMGTPEVVGVGTKRQNGVVHEGPGRKVQKTLQATTGGGM
jgi:hypothetical protein